MQKNTIATLLACFIYCGIVAQSEQIPGAINPAFGSTGPGFTIFNPGGTFDVANAIAIDSQGRILLAGFSNVGVTVDFALARFSPDGVLDTSFGSTGPGFTLFGFSVGSQDIAFAMVIDGQGRILLAGQSDSAGTTDFALARFSPDGVLDTSFGSTGPGFTLFAFPGGGADIANAMALDSQGRILLAGQSDSAGTNDFALARFSPDGVLDTSFGSTGPGFTLFGFLGGSTDRANAMVLDSQGRILLAGDSNSAGTTDFALARFSPDGVLDTSFGSTGPGFTLFAFPGVATDIANAMVLDSQGRILLAGGSGITPDFALARFSPDGVLDTSFGSTGPGFTLFDFLAAGGADIPLAMIINPQGAILLGGNTDAQGPIDFALAQFFGEEFGKCTLAIREKYCFLP